MSPHLIVCPSERGLTMLRPLLESAASSIVVASDDPCVHDAATAAGAGWSWLEGCESVYAVVEEAREITEAINGWLKSLASDNHGIARELLFWVKHAEGGQTTQRLQDLLLIVRGYSALLDSTRPSKVTVLLDAEYEWELRVFSALCAARAIPAAIVLCSRPRAWAARVCRWVDVHVREPHAILVWLGARALEVGVDAPPRPADLLIQLCDSSTKHSSFVRLLLESFSRSGTTAAALCWRAPRAARLFRLAGLRADCLERWVSSADVVSAFIRTVRTWRAAVRRRSWFFELSALNRAGFALGPHLWPAIAFFIKAELPSRWRLKVATERYFNALPPKMVRFWTTLLPEAVISYGSASRRGTRPLVLHTPAFPYAYVDPYPERSIPVDLELAVSEEHRRILESDGWACRRTVTVGHDRRQSLDMLKGAHTRADSRARLGVPPHAALTVLFDSSYVIRGFFSSREQTAILSVVLRLARRHPDVTLLVKPHPRHRGAWLDERIRAAQLANVFRLDSGCLPHHALNAADVLVTKASTLGLEAIYLERPIIAVLLDGETRFQLYADAAHYTDNVADLEALLERLSEPAELDRWTRAWVERERRYIERSGYPSGMSPTDLTADAVICAIRDWSVDAAPPEPPVPASVQ